MPVCAADGPGRLQPRLSSLVCEIRETSREARKLARKRAHGGPLDYQACLADLFDCWIASSRGRQRLIRLASAAELGVLTLEHLVLGDQAVSQTDDRALRALYWTTAQRWQRTLRPGARPAPAPLQDHGAPSHDAFCEACDDLRNDPRRHTPHAGLGERFSSDVTRAKMHATCWFQCAECSTRWVRRTPLHEPFAVWSVLPMAA